MKRLGKRYSGKIKISELNCYIVFYKLYKSLSFGLIDDYYGCYDINGVSSSANNPLGFCKEINFLSIKDFRENQKYISIFNHKLRRSKSIYTCKLSQRKMYEKNLILIQDV
jgi:hypothetical protein